MTPRCARCRATRDQHQAGPTLTPSKLGHLDVLRLCPRFVPRAPWWMRALNWLWP